MQAPQTERHSPARPPSRPPAAARATASAAKPAPSPASTDADRAAARAAGLRHVTDAKPGASRRRAGERWDYFDPKGVAIDDAVEIARIDKLAIPPAYTDVWICPDPRGHIQATGRDARGRKQYRYHAQWRQTRDTGKFQRIVAFGQRLPRLRRKLSKDLKLTGMPRDKVLAIVVSLLAETLIRVGNHEYARSNNSFGLTTLRNRHVRFPRDSAIFTFRGKSGKDHVVELEDERLAKLLRRCQQLPGQNLFQYLDDDGNPHAVDSGDVNDYLRAACGEDFTAKDFRTWGGTLEAIRAFVRAPMPRGASERTIAAVQNAAVREVATQLGNTPAVCRSSYIHPAVFRGWRNGALAKAVPETALNHPRKLESLALAFLADPSARRMSRAVH
jgi:DNA topoisomerase I